jgi:glycosyltransferase involved in cell wall biosynthesis
VPEIEEIRKQGHEVLVVPMYPRGPVLHGHVKRLLVCTVTRPLLSPGLIWSAGDVLRRHPSKALDALRLLTGSSSAKVLLKNLAVYPKGLWLARLVREWGADHIHAHWAATTATMALVASEVSDIPWSFTAHSWDITDWRFLATPPGSTENALLSLKASRACFVRFISRNGMRKAGSLGTVGSQDTRVFVLHMGVELADSPEVRRAKGQGRLPVVLCPALFIPVKGHRYLIEAVAMLRERGVDLQLWLAGKGELEEELRGQARKAGLSDRVDFLGQLPHPELMGFYRRGEVDMMVLPSVDLGGGEHEGLPVSLVEAMSYRVPVVSTTTGGIPELLGGGAGMLVPPADPASLAGAIETLVEDPGLRERQGNAGRRQVEENFALEKVADELIARFEACTRQRCERDSRRG